jgi:hypothetical protein
MRRQQQRRQGAHVSTEHQHAAASAQIHSACPLLPLPSLHRTDVHRERGTRPRLLVQQARKGATVHSSGQAAIRQDTHAGGGGGVLLLYLVRHASLCCLLCCGATAGRLLRL